jgi:hypothetical protein
MRVHEKVKPLRVTYSNDPTVVATWLSTALQASPGAALGVDTEAKPAYIKLEPGQMARGPDVLQLSTCQECLVVQLSAMRTRKHKNDMQRVLGPLLRDIAVLKVGVGIDDDALDFWRSSGGLYEIRGRVDLGGVGTSPSRTRGLANLTEAILGIELGKSKSVTKSNWAASPPLSLKQVEYAAKDAWAAAAVHAELRRRRPDLFDRVKLKFACPKGIPQMERSLEEILDRRTRRRAHVTTLKEIVDNQKAVKATESEDFFACVDEAVEAQMDALRRTIVNLETDAVVHYGPEEVGLAS